eukprot:scaffold51276_cov57-Cyclotella_meneghiniana.AAC.1
MGEDDFETFRREFMTDIVTSLCNDLGDDIATLQMDPDTGSYNIEFDVTIREFKQPTNGAQPPTSTLLSPRHPPIIKMRAETSNDCRPVNNPLLNYFNRKDKRTQAKIRQAMKQLRDKRTQAKIRQAMTQLREDTKVSMLLQKSQDIMEPSDKSPEKLNASLERPITINVKESLQELKESFQQFHQSMERSNQELKESFQQFQQSMERSIARHTASMERSIATI